jgi:hypothetical protein
MHRLPSTERELRDRYRTRFEETDQLAVRGEKIELAEAPHLDPPHLREDQILDLSPPRIDAKERQDDRRPPRIDMLGPPHLGPDLGLDPKLLAQLAPQALPDRLANFALAAGKLPPAGVGLIRAPLTREDLPVSHENPGAYVDWVGRG